MLSPLPIVSGLSGSKDHVFYAGFHFFIYRIEDGLNKRVLGVQTLAISGFISQHERARRSRGATR